MARIKDGKISGKIGDLVGVSQDGKNYVRKLPQRTAAPTEAELRNRFLLELLSHWLKPLTPFLRKGFRNYSWNFEGFNAAFSVNYRDALQKNGYDSLVDPALVKVSSGDLALPQNLQVTLTPGRELEFTWTPAVNRDQGPRDRLMSLAYNIENETALYELCGAIRYDGSDSLNLAAAIPGTYHIYGAFASEDGSRQSESRYLGSFQL